VHGANSLTDTELLALLLDDAPNEETRLQQAQQLLQDHHGLVGLSRLAVDELGTSADGAARIKAALELARRLFSVAPRERPVINCASKLAHHLLLDMSSMEQEVLKCALLTTQLR
jgi:DNA repair protein RadC